MPGLQPEAEVGRAHWNRFIPNSKMEQDEREQSLALQNSEVILGLASHVKKRWETAKSAKEDLTLEMLRCLRQREGQYEPEVLQQIREHGASEIYMQLTNVKCRAAAAWLRDIMVPQDDRAWSVQPSPRADLPPTLANLVRQQVTSEMMAFVQQMMAAGEQVPVPALQEKVQLRIEQLREEVRDEQQHLARKIAERMTAQMDDQLAEGHWDNAFLELVDDMVTFPFCVMKGPFIRSSKRLKWATLLMNGDTKTTPFVDDVHRPEFERRSPFDIYPSPGARDIQDGYLFDRYRCEIRELERMKDSPDFNAAAIDEAIMSYGRGGHRELLYHDHERAQLERRSREWLVDDERIEALNYWGTAPGFMLQEWGIREDVDATRSYDVECWLVGRYVIKATLNPDPMGKRPYSKTCYEKSPGSFSGQGIPQLIRDDQEMCNGAARALSNNMGIASGPQVMINDVDRLPAGEDVTSLFPWKIWQFGPDKMAAARQPSKPIEFYQPNALVQELMEVFEQFSRNADEHAALPAYVYGGTERVGGAGSTASGLAMLMGQASKSMKLVIGNLDKDVVQPRIEALYIWNMLNSPHEDIKGDCFVVPRGSSSLLVREQRQIRLNEALGLTSNDIDIGILGAPGRAVLLREALKDMVDIPIDDFIPDPESLRMQQQQQQAAAAQQVDPAQQQREQLELVKEQNKAEQIQVDRQKMDYEHELATSRLDKEFALKGAADERKALVDQGKAAAQSSDGGGEKDRSERRVAAREKAAAGRAKLMALR